MLELGNWLAAPARRGRQEEQQQELLVRHPVRVGGDLGQPQPGEQRLHRQQRARDFVSGLDRGVGYIGGLFLHTTITVCRSVSVGYIYIYIY